MKLRRIVSCMMALLLVCSLPVSAFAAEYDLALGSVIVNATESGQTVTHGTNAPVEDSAPVITQSTAITTNTITINAAENATANVTIQDVNIVISDPTDNPQDHSGQAAVSIDVADNASANVTLDGVSIDTKNTGGVSYDEHDFPVINSGEAAVQITGNGDVTLELDEENTVQGGYVRAGVEKNTTDSSGNGNLTITDESGTDGSLNATGGHGGAGIGGVFSESGSNITIAGSAEVTATGGVYGSGIGGGGSGSGSNIKISDTAEVIAQGGIGGAGIGGGPLSTGSNITITGSAEVTAKGGASGAGIGGGRQSTGSSDITVSGDAQVKAQGGQVDTNTGAGAAIGEGGKWNGNTVVEVTPNTDALNEGWVAKYAPDSTNLDTAVPNSLTYKGAPNVTGAQPIVKLEPTCTEDGHEAGFSVDGALVAVTIPATGHSFTNYVSNNDGSKTAKCDNCDATHTIPAPVSESVPEEVPQTAPLYRVIGQDGKAIACKAEQKGGVLTITVDADFATLTGSASGLKTLKEQGLDTIVFVTNGATSTFALADLLAQVPSGNTYALTHVGSTVTLTLSSGEDISSILK